jgi:nucleotide-binding universal stress UspA family protein
MRSGQKERERKGQMKILVAVDGSKQCLKAVDSLIEHADWYRSKPEVELVTVHLPLPAVGIGKGQAQKYYQEEGASRLVEPKKRLDAAGIRYQAQVLVGPIAETLVKHAKSAGCDLIYIGTRGLTATAGALLGSTSTKVLNLSTTPVLLVK